MVLDSVGVWSVGASEPQTQAFGFKTSKVTPPVLVTCLTVTVTTRNSSGLGSRTAGFFLHLGQLLSACVPSLLVASMDTWSECTVNWSVILWCFCFGGTLHCLHSGIVSLRPCSDSSATPTGSLASQRSLSLMCGESLSGMGEGEANSERHGEKSPDGVPVSGSHQPP